jgi:TonB family protein
MMPLGEWLANFWIGVAYHLWQTSVVLLLIFVFARAMRFAPARATQALWGAAFLKILLPVSILGEPILALTRTVGMTRGAEGFFLEPVRAVLNPSGFLDPRALAAEHWAGICACALTAIWGIGVATRMRRLMGDCARSTRDRGIPIGQLPGGRRARLKAALAGTEIPAHAVRVSRSASLPYVAGLFRPCILVPSELLHDADADELRALLLHEDGHRRRRDPLRAAAMRCCGAFLFFYPPLAYVARRLRESAEILCDERAVRSGLARETYAKVLAATLRRNLFPIVDPLSAGLGGGPGLRVRFERISCPWRYSMMNRHRLILGAVLLLIAVVTFLPAPLLAGEDSSGSPAELQKVETMPVLVKMVQPVYPAEERKNGVEGTVMLRMRVTASGSVGQILVMETIEGHPAFNDAAIDAARQWIFTPATTDGEPVACWVAVPIRFALK